jgi:DNA replication initiation complex subunit (GINS family)
MSNEQLFQQVRLHLERNLTPEERKFLTLASQAIRQEKDQPSKPANGKSKLSRIAV